MKHFLRLGTAAWLISLASIGLHAQSSDVSARAQENFALAVAKAHARSSLFGAGSSPFAIHATIWSGLALRGTGKGTYDNRWVDNQHWRREIRFPDFQQTEMRNDSGHSWVAQSTDTMPLRIAEMLRVIVLHVPGSNTASNIPVTETEVAGENGGSLTCYSSAPPLPADAFPRRFGWCFDTASGLLVSQDMPLNTHIVYSNYIAFQGKHEFTQVHVTSGSLPVLDIELQYFALDAHALDGSAPEGAMHRSASAGWTPNPEELGKGAVQYRFSPLLPIGTPEADKARPVQLQFQISKDNAVLDACVEDAPTVEMARAALLGAPKFTFASMTVDGETVVSRFYQSIWFHSAASDTSSPSVAEEESTPLPPVPSEAAPKSIFRSTEPAFAFRYPVDFDLIPRGQLEDDLRFGKSALHYGFVPGDDCTTLLFKAQRLRPGQRTPEVISITDLAPTCVFGLLDKKTPETMAANAAQSIVAQLGHGSAAKPKRYTVNGRTFAVVPVSGTARNMESQPVNALLAVTVIREHVVGWMVMGSASKDQLAQTLAACTLQTGDEKEGSLFPLSKKP